MSQRDGLGFLQMGESGHICVHIFPHNSVYDRQKRLEQALRLVDLIPHIQLHVQRHLVVPASARVELFPGVSDPLDQICLHKTVDILILGSDFQGSVLDIPLDPLQAADYGVSLFLCQDFLLCQHFHVSDTAPDVLTVKLLIETDGRVKIVDEPVCLLGKTASP